MSDHSVLCSKTNQESGLGSATIFERRTLKPISKWHKIELFKGSRQRVAIYKQRNWRFFCCLDDIFTGLLQMRYASINFFCFQTSLRAEGCSTVTKIFQFQSNQKRLRFFRVSKSTPRFLILHRHLSTD